MTLMDEKEQPTRSAALNGATAELCRLLSEKLLIDVPTPETDLLSTGLLDSLGLIQLLTHIEESFGVRIALDEIEIEDLRSVSSIASLVVKQQPEFAGK